MDKMNRGTQASTDVFIHFLRGRYGGKLGQASLAAGLAGGYFHSHVTTH